MDWSNELVLEFLELYEDEPAIWSPKHPNHKNRNLVHDSWKRIEANLSVKSTVAELKKKKDALMATYRKLWHRQKVKASTGTGGTGTDGVFKPDWFAYECMHRFLHGIYKPNETKSPEELPNTEVDIREETPSTSSTPTSVLPDSRSTMFTSVPASSTAQTNVPNPKRRKIKVSILENAANEPKTVHQDINNVGDDNNERECEIFGEYVAVQLKQMPLEERIIAQSEINNVLSNARLRQIRFNSNSSSFSSAQSSSMLLVAPSMQYSDISAVTYSPDTTDFISTSDALSQTTSAVSEAPHNEICYKEEDPYDVV